MSDVILPKYLQRDSTVGIVATARWMEAGQLDFAMELLKEWGLKVKVSGELYNKYGQLAGPDELRAAEFQFMLNDPEIDAILVARGGYGTVRIVDRLDWSGFRAKPKWICGYSDITVLLSELSNAGIAAIHSTMPISFKDATPIALIQLKDALFGALTNIEWKPEHTSSDYFEVRGPVVGGNLSVIFSTLGSRTQLKTEGGILFLEDVDEHLYHLDRMFWALRRAGLFDGVKAIVLGGMTQMKDNTVEFGFKTDNPWGIEIYDMIKDCLPEPGLFVIDGFPAGHQAENRAFYTGRMTILVLKDGMATLRYL